MLAMVISALANVYYYWKEKLMSNVLVYSKDLFVDLRDDLEHFYPITNCIQHSLSDWQWCDYLERLMIEPNLFTSM